MTPHPTLFITHRGERHQHAALAAAPLELSVTMRRSPSRDEVLALLPSVEFLITERSGVIDADMISAGKQLRLIQRLGSLTYDIDLRAAQAAGIPVCSSSVPSSIMVAEHMLLQMLALAKRLREMMDVTAEARDYGRPPQRSDEDHFAYNWTGRRSVMRLSGATVGILGMGEIGAELARLLRGFHCTILYSKRNPLPAVAEDELGVRFATPDQMLARSDVICTLLPFLPDTDQSVGERFFARMKPGSLFVSCGGSGVVDEAALADAVSSGHLGGAALDTFTFEPIAPDDPMLLLARAARANVILTPHVAGLTGGGRTAGRTEDYSNVLRCLAGEPLVGCLN